MKNSQRDWRRCVCLAVLLSISLVGCDGGIFGTGDGSSSDSLIDIPISADSDLATDDLQEGTMDETPEGPESNSDSIPAAAPDESEDADGNSAVTGDDAGLFGFSASTDVAISNGTTIGFTNDVVVNDNSDAGLSVINLSNVSISAFTSTDANALPIAATTVTEVQANGDLPSSTDRVLIDSIDNTGQRASLALIEPTALASGSRSLLIVRRTEPTVDLIVLPTNIVDEELLQNSVGVRLVSAALVGDPEVPSNFFLATDESILPDQSDTIEFEPLTYQQPVSNYRIVQPGLFVLSDDAGRYSSVSIDLSSPGTLVTIVLDPSLPNQHLVVGN